jgi:hypothetical protein
MFPLHQGLLLVAMIDAQPDVFSITFKTCVAKDRTYDDISAMLGQTH